MVYKYYTDNTECAFIVYFKGFDTLCHSGGHVIFLQSILKKISVIDNIYGSKYLKEKKHSPGGRTKVNFSVCPKRVSTQQCEETDR